MDFLQNMAAKIALEQRVALSETGARLSNTRMGKLNWMPWFVISAMKSP
jgi:hypothetical protein